VLSVVRYKISDAVIPVSFSKELQNGNITISILCGEIVIGVCRVTAAALR
jgi:hypothetical protein